MNTLQSDLVRTFLFEVVSESALQLSFSTQIRSGRLEVLFTGPDTPMLLAHEGELLLALEHMATQVLRLRPEQEDCVSFDAEGWRAERGFRMLMALGGGNG